MVVEEQSTRRGHILPWEVYVMVVVYPRLVLALAALVLVLFLLALRYDPAQPVARALHHGVWGLALLLVWNAVFTPHLGINPLSVWLAGALQLPGLGLLAVLAQLS